jgi:protein involved in sex pheromone biosynthesis
MKKVLSTLAVAGIIALVACGPSAEEKAAAEKAMQDSIAQAEQAAGAMQEAAAMQDSANSMMDSAATKMAGEEAK